MEKCNLETKAKGYSNLEVLELVGTDMDALNAFINAVRANTFITFNENFSADFSLFFKKCFAVIDNKQKDLSIAYKQLAINEVAELWKEVFEIRKTQLSFLFENKSIDINIDNLSDLERVQYLLMYKFGDKLGGYQAIASLNPEETIKLWNIFNSITDKEVEAIKKMSQSKRKSK